MSQQPVRTSNINLRVFYNTKTVMKITINYSIKFDMAALTASSNGKPSGM